MKYTQEELQQFEDPDFSAPIPGQGLTAELGSRPWDKPPQYPTVLEALDFYTEKVFSKEGTSSIADALQAGLPAIDLAEQITTSGVMNGLHTVDVGVLAVPAVAESIAMIGNIMDIEFTMGNEEDDNVVSDSMVDLITQRMSKGIEKDNGLTDELNMDDFDLSDEDVQYLDMEDYETPAEEPMMQTPAVGGKGMMAVEDTTKSIPSQGLMARRV